MSEESQLTEREWHRKFGGDLFNHVWTLLEKPDRSQAEDDQMVHEAHASRYHWAQVGTGVNFARGEWQISRVYSVLKRPEPALYHAQRCLDICQENGVGDFDLAFAYEALARASAVAGQKADRQRYLAMAREAGEQIKEKEDKEIFFGDLATA